MEGLLINPKHNELIKMDPSLYGEVSNLKDSDVLNQLLM
jgi:hypothetical protein